jgi:adenylate cyclase
MTDTTLKQRLAAILCADAAGYSRLMSRDERATVATLDAARVVFQAQTLGNQGRVVDTAGDSILAIFETAAGALNAAVQVQARLADAHADIPAERRMQFRIGLHLGDVIEKADGSVYGDGVNIAARLQALAEPGGIIVSESIHTAVRGKVPASFEDQGEQTVKNIAHPLRSYRIRPQAGAANPVPRTADGTAAYSTEIDLSLPDKPSIAVLPFVNMSGDPEQEYFTDGISEDIITELSRFHSLFVIARNSSFSYKGKSPDIRQVGKELGVRYVLEGSIRRSGSRIRVTSQLIDALTGNHIWAEKYDRVLEDIFALQEELARSLVISIAPKIADAEAARVARRRPRHLGAYEAAIRANSRLATAFAMPGGASSAGALRDLAISEARAALDMDPNSTMALNAVANGQLQHVMRGTAVDSEAAWRDGIGAANRSIEIDRSDGEPYALKGVLLALAGGPVHTDEALAAARQSHELNPNNIKSLICLAFVENLCGDPEQAVGHMRHALRISPRDPLRPFLYQQLAMSCLCLGRYADGLAYGAQGVAEAPGLSALHAYIAMNNVGLGELDGAKLAYQAAQRAGAEYVDRVLAGELVSRKPVCGRRAITFLRIAAGLEDPGAADALR